MILPLSELTIKMSILTKFLLLVLALASDEYPPLEINEMKRNDDIEKVNIVAGIEGFYDVVYVQNLKTGKEEAESISNTYSKFEASMLRAPKVMDQRNELFVKNSLSNKFNRIIH